MSLNNLKFDKKTGTFRSGQWDISSDDAQSLIGGWLYLHATKSAPSEFGGVVLGIERVKDGTLAHPDRIIFVIRKNKSGAGQKWRGKAHGMAHNSGVLEADLPHETE